jgi:hypothetical protein
MIAGTVAFNNAELMKVVATGVLFQRTWLPGRKPPPETVSVKPAVPAAVDAGLTLESEGGVTENGRAFDRAEALFITDMSILPGIASADAGTVADNCVLFINAVAKVVPPHCTTLALTNPLPVTVRLRAELPAIAALGVIPESDGREIVNAIVPELKILPNTPTGFTTPIVPTPGIAILSTGTTAVNCVGPR